MLMNLTPWPIDPKRVLIDIALKFSGWQEEENQTQVLLTTELVNPKSYLLHRLIGRHEMHGLTTKEINNKFYVNVRTIKQLQHLPYSSHLARRLDHTGEPYTSWLQGFKMWHQTFKQKKRVEQKY
jgi:hypothetical protein